MSEHPHGPPAADPEDWKTWRRARRHALIEQRKALDPNDRGRRSAAIDHWLEAGFHPVAGHDVGFCWPFAAEPDSRFAVRRWRERGSRAALPVVAEPRTPLEFRQWQPGVPMAKGVYGIPYPIDADVLAPEVVLVPVNGFDLAGYRLGYGSGYFDRTLASFERHPVCVGLGFEISRMETIYPQPHDIPFDFIVTERGIHHRQDSDLVAVEEDIAAELVARRLA